MTTSHGSPLGTTGIPTWFTQGSPLANVPVGKELNSPTAGGDDLKMKGWDVRQGGTQPIFTNKRFVVSIRHYNCTSYQGTFRFDAGVTTIQSHPHIEHILAVGSYDSTVRLFDTRKPSTPLTQVDVGGGANEVPA